MRWPGAGGCWTVSGEEGRGEGLHLSELEGGEFLQSLLTGGELKSHNLSLLESNLPLTN